MAKVEKDKGEFPVFCHLLTGVFNIQYQCITLHLYTLFSCVKKMVQSWGYVGLSRPYISLVLSKLFPLCYIMWYTLLLILMSSNIYTLHIYINIYMYIIYIHYITHYVAVLLMIYTSLCYVVM